METPVGSRKAGMKLPHAMATQAFVLSPRAMMRVLGMCVQGIVEFDVSLDVMCKSLF